MEELTEEQFFCWIICVWVWAREEQCLLHRGHACFNMSINPELHADNKAPCAAGSLCLLWATPAQLLSLSPRKRITWVCLQAGHSQSRNKGRRGGEMRWIWALTVTWGPDLFVSIKRPSFLLLSGPLSVFVFYQQRKQWEAAQSADCVGHCCVRCFVLKPVSIVLFL